MVGDADYETVSAMAERLLHRGPDSLGLHHEPGVALGMRRLAIVDVAGGRQPVYNEDRTIVAVFNGELYNYPEIRAELLRRGHRLGSSGDSECLVHLYEEYGEDLVHHLRGMFAFAIWDGNRRRLLLARDRVGKKPLYWRADGGTLSFASEMKALLADPTTPRDLDLTALNHYLTYQYVPAPWSILSGVRKLPPASLLTWQDGRHRVRRYWRLDCTPVKHASLADAEQRLRDLLLDATKVRMLSERPLGAFLSGGIDSTAVVAAMTRFATGQVKTFCIGFADQAFDEAPYARAAAKYLGTEHHEFIVDSGDITAVTQLACHFDEPFADSSAIPTLQVARMASRHVTVVLNGDGGDENFGGYPRYVFIAKAGWIPGRLVSHLGAQRVGAWLASRSRPRSRRRDVGRALEVLGSPSARRYARIMSYFSPEQSASLYTPEVAAQLSEVDSYRLLDEAFAASHATSDLGRAMDADVNMYLPGDLLVKVDITTMACSLEARSPFLDHHLMQWAAGLPDRWRINGRTTKYLLRRAVQDWIPRDLAARPKMGFGVPLADWLRGDLREMSHDLLTDGTAASRGLFRLDVMRRLLQEHQAGYDHSVRLWALLQFELWARTWLDSRPDLRLAQGCRTQ